MNATLIDQPALRLIVAPPKSFPDGVPGAFSELEKPLESLRGRKFYGLAYTTSEPMEYLAGLVPADAEEETRFAMLGFSIKDVPGGPCARVKIVDWRSKLDQLAPMFREMISEYGYDSTRPQMEFYRSLKELHLLLPVPPHSE